MRVHVLKTWPAFFDTQASGAKTFEVRRDDRGFEVGDVLVLRKWDPASEAYTGGTLGRRVTYVCLESFVAPGFCVMSTVPLSAEEWQAALDSMMNSLENKS